jgi:nucleotide-binding universal stress UspA family protein
MYERVLVPLDGSELAEAVLPFAEQVAGPLDAEVLLLRVVEPLSPFAGLGTGGIVEPDSVFLRQLEAKRYLEAVAGRLQAKGLRARTTLALGTPAPEVVATARAERADLIAMSTHGRGGFKQAIFGSVAAEVLRSAEVPVLLFRKPAAVPAPAEAGR